MNELEALNRLYGCIMGTSNYYKQFLSSTPYINADKELIEKELKDGEKYKKAVEIIKKDPQRALLISDYKDYDEYIHDKDPYWIEKELMKKEEFDLLKEVFK